MYDSGKAIRRAPLPAASAIRSQAFAIVASRSRNTGAAWTTATVKDAFDSGVSIIPCSYKEPRIENREPRTDQRPIPSPQNEKRKNLLGCFTFYVLRFSPRT